jgi:NADPH:quinone reductase-like Zn-dependent oxidoreductase
MKAIRIEQYGGPEVLQRVDIAIPSPGPDDVLIRVGCAGINFMDIHTRQGGRYTLDNVEAAHEALESRRQLGKPVMTIS